MDFRFNKDDKFVREYWDNGDKVFVFRTKDGIEYHIPYTKAMEILYDKKKLIDMI